ncbi:MAG: helix-turn-helix domain-containing protein [Ardenticatenales bacterium]|nr:helix-turn-helix domain-containing protein [Ardenticatenales bacterium]
MAEVSLLTIRDVQEITQLGRTTIYELMREGRLPYLKIGRSVRIRREALEKWLAELEASERLLSLPF